MAELEPEDMGSATPAVGADDACALAKIELGFVPRDAIHMAEGEWPTVPQSFDKPLYAVVV